jgi:acetyl esterase/lipase
MSKNVRLRFLALGALLGLAALPQPAIGKPFVDHLPPDVQIKADLEYVPGGGAVNTLDLYLPKTDAPLIPLVVFIHGGGWNSGTDKDWHPSFGDLLSHGFAVATINYRMVQQGLFPAQIYDCKAAVRWLRSHAADYHLDPDHIGVWGHSAGGHLSALMGVTNDLPALEGNEGVKGVSSSVQAACDWSGPTDLVKTLEEGPTPSPALYRVVVGLVGGPDKANKDNLAQASPITYVNSKCPPFLIMQGDKDKIVPTEQSTLLDAALKKAGVDSTLILVPGADHGSISKPDNLKPVTAFFEKHLKTT